MPAIFKIKIKHGTAEFEAEGTQKFVEAKLKEFRPMLSLPKSGKAERVVGKKRKKGGMPKASYPQAAIKPLKKFLKKAKPKTQIDAMLAIGMHHMQHFKATSFTNKDLASAAAAVGKKLGNISAQLRLAEKAKKIKKLGKGTWQLLTGNTTVSKPVKKAKPKKATKAKPAPKPKLKKVAARIKTKPAAKAQPKKSAAKPKAKPAPKSEPKSEPAKAPESAPF